MNPLNIFSKVTSAVKQWLNRIARKGKSATSDTGGLGTVNQSEIRRFKWQQRKRRGWNQERLGRGVWAPGLEMVQEWIDNLQGKLLAEGAESLEEEAEKYAQMVRDSIYHQQYRWVPLTKRYLAWKKRVNRDARIYLATHEFVQSIQVIPTEEGEKIGFIVGLPDKLHVDSGLPIRKLAAIHEFGSPKMNIPARPVWRPTWERFRREAKARITARLKAFAEKETKQLQKELMSALPGVTISVRTR